VLDSAAKVDRHQEAFRLSDLYTPLDGALWSDLVRAGAIAAPRRELQRDHVNRLANTLLHPQARADARSLLRQQAQTLLVKLDAVNRRGTHRDAETRAHLIDCADSLRQALAARLPRSSV
jgi:BMFP domain-containing protein YqiC